MDLFDVLLTRKLSGGGSSTSIDQNAVHYSSDNGKTAAQKLAARTNIDAEASFFNVNFDYANGEWFADKTFAEVLEAKERGKHIALYVYGQFVAVASEFGPGGNSLTSLFFTGNFTDHIVSMIRFNSADEVFIENINLQPSAAHVNVSSATPAIAAADNTIYLCGELTSLMVSSIPASGLFEIVFKSGAAATTVTLPQNILFPDGFTFEADTIYDISVRVCSVAGDTYGLAAVQGWPVTST